MIFHIGSVPIETHDFFVLLGVVVATGVFIAEAVRRRMLSEQLLWVVVGSLFCGAVAARSGAAWDLLATGRWATIAATGRSILGGLAGAYIGAVVTKRIVGYKQRTGDLFAPAVAAGMAIGRWGCFLTEGVGTPTGMPWGITLSTTAAADIPNCPTCVPGVPLHPSFIYEIVFHVVALFVLIGLRSRVHVPGELLKIYLLAYAIFRFGVEFVRGHEVVVASLTRSQLFLIPSTILLLAYFFRQFTQRAYAAPEGAMA